LVGYCGIVSLVEVAHRASSYRNNFEPLSGS